MFNFSSLSSDPVRLNKIIHETNNLTDEDFVEKQIEDFKASMSRKLMLDGERYFEGAHDILNVKRTVSGEGGELEEVKNLPNNQIIDNQYQKMVDQKKNYLLGKPTVFNSKNKKYNELLETVLNKKFQRLIKNIGEDALNCGIGWLFLNYDDQGNLVMKRLKSYQVIPGWKDFEHEELDWLIYFYDYETPSGDIVEKVEVYDENGIYRFVRDGNNLIPDEEPFDNYFSIVDPETEEETPFNWLKLPIIPFRYNTKEIPLIRKVKSLQDAINQILSTFANNMEEDARNTILILVNYDGQNLGEFRRNLAQYGAVKVRNDSTTGGGDVKTLQVEVNAENYKVILKLFKDALIENARGYDGKDDRLNGTPNQMNIQSMYSDIDLDANEMETEFQASMEQLLYFINIYFSHLNKGNFEDTVDVIFNRDMMLNESEIITNIRNSTGIISRKSQVKNHPWIDDVDDEMQLIDEEEKEPDDYENAFTKVGAVDVKEE